MTTLNQPQAEAQLLRIPYTSKAAQEQREYLLYLPAGYETDREKRWPVLLFLHGGGERGDGREDLDYVLVHGPLGEAWIQGRDLPFIMIGPQLPVFGMNDQVRLRENTPKPKKLPSGSPPRADERRPDYPPMTRLPDPTPSDYGVTEAWPAPGGWHLCEEEVMAMVDRTLAEYRTDPERVYLTGISYGGYGTWYLATAYPERWAAIAPICGNCKPDLAYRLAYTQTPIWIFQGGRDAVIKADMIYKIAATLEEAGHKTVRLTIHEDLGHDCWTRVYAGEDLYQWLLGQSLSNTKLAALLPYSAEILHALITSAAPETVYQALTEQAGLAVWLCPDTSAEPRAGSIAEFRFDRGTIRVEIVQLEPNRKVVWKLLQGMPGWEEQAGLITWRLVPAEGGTLVRFSHGGWETKDYDSVSYKWAWFMTNLRKYVETGSV